MATKLYNTHLSTLLFECNEYYILDTYISLVSLSSEVNNRYIIQTYSDSKADLISLVRRSVNATYKTIFNCINRLITLSIIKFDIVLQAWTIVDLELMHSSKNSLIDGSNNKTTGYTNIRKLFLSETFSKMKAREKRLLVYMAQLSDSKAGVFHGNFSMNLLKNNSPWMKVLKTKNKYYAKYTIERMLLNYNDLFEDISLKERANDIAPEKTKRFKFSFNCSKIKNSNLEKDTFDHIKETFNNEYLLVKNKLQFFDITLTNNKIMHIIRSISTISEWALKERVVQLIINKYIAIQKYKSREDIKSLPAYAATVVRSVIDEFNQFKDNLNNNLSLNNYEVGQYYLDNANSISDNIENLNSYSIIS